MIGLSAISIYLSGMELGKTQKPDFIIKMEPCGGYFELTEKTRLQYEEYLQKFNIKLHKGTKKIICTQPKGRPFQYNQNKELPTTHPIFLPLDLFTNNQPLAILQQNIASGFKNLNNFQSHFDLIDPNKTKSQNKTIQQAIATAASLQEQLTNNLAQELGFLVNKNTQQEQEQEQQEIADPDNRKDLKKKLTLDHAAMPGFFDNIVKQDYEKQCEMISKIDEKQHPDLLKEFVQIKKLKELISETYDNLKKEAQIEKELKTDNIILNNDDFFSFEDSLYIYWIFQKKDFNFSYLVRSDAIKKIIQQCDTFTKKIVYKKELQLKNTIEPNMPSISIPIAIINLCATLKTMVEDFDKDKKNDANINFPIPNNIDPIILQQLCELLDQNLVITCDDLEKAIITDYTTTLKKDINNISLKSLTQLLNTADYLRVAEEITKENAKEPTKIILVSLLQSTCLNKLKETPHETRAAIIETLNENIQSKLLSIFLEDTKISDILKKIYKDLKITAEIYYHLNIDGSVKNALSDKNKNLTLNHAFLINDILKNPNFINNFNITDKTVSPLVNEILQNCNNFNRIIEKKKKIIEEKKKKVIDENEKLRIAQEKEYNSFTARFTRKMAQYKQLAATYKKPLIFGTLFISYCALFTYYFSDQLKTLLFLKYFNIFKA